MSKVVYALIDGVYYKLDQNPNVPDKSMKNIPNLISSVERVNLNELELQVSLSTIDVNTAKSNREECNIMKSVLRACPNIRDIQVIPNHYKMKLTYTIFDENMRPVDNSSTMRDITAEDVLLPLGVDKYNEALYRRVKYFSPRFKFLVRNIVPYGIMKNAKKSYTFQINDISLYQETVDSSYGENLHLSTYENPYAVCSPCMNEPLGNMLLLYSTNNEGITYQPFSISYVPRSVYVSVKMMLDGYLSFYTESEVQAILEENKNKPHHYESCDTVITVRNRVELNDDYKPETPELFYYNLTSDDSFLPDERRIIIPDCGSANFGTLTFTEPGIYNYTVTQDIGTDEMYNYSTQVFKVRVTVTDHDYVLDAKVDIFDENGDLVPGINYVNYYGITPAYLQLPVTNTIRGTEPEVKETFTYLLAPVTMGAPMPCNNTTQIVSSGVCEFNPIEFKTPGTYVYSLTQVPGTTENCVYDRKTIDITVVATKVTNAMALAVSFCADDDFLEKAEFINVYDYLPSHVVVNINNTISGDVPEEDETFTFIIKPVTANAPDVENDKISILGAGDGEFGPIDLLVPGFYVYQITQSTCGDVHYEYDKSVFFALITVEDDFGILKSTVEFAHNSISDKVGAIMFVNKYKALDEDTAIAITTHMITDGTGIPNDDGYLAYYSYCRPTNPNALVIVDDDTPAEEYNDLKMIPKTCVLNDLPDAVSGKTVLFNECVPTI